MPTVDIDSERISSILEHMLARPPAKVGTRLLSQHQLARLFGVNRWEIRRSIDRLTEKGVLVRRQGSGTYVRKIPEVKSAKMSFPLPGDMPLTPEDLFATGDVEDEADLVRLKPTRTQRRLRLSLWSDLHTARTPQHKVLAAIVSRANQLGQDLVLNSIVERSDVPLSVSELSRRLRSDPSDGYLVIDRWADLFRQALGKREAPIVYLDTWNTQIRHEPLVTLNTEEACQRGIRLLAEQGWKRIGLVALSLASHLPTFVQKTYERVIRELGLQYTRVLLTPFDLTSSVEAASRMLSEPDRPDALYVDDDFVLAGVSRAIDDQNLVLGRDLGLITMSNRGLPLPAGREWSTLEFDLEMLGQMVVDLLLRQIQEAGAGVSNLQFAARWIPGKTFQKRSSDIDDSGAADEPVAADHI